MCHPVQHAVQDGSCRETERQEPAGHPVLLLNQNVTAEYPAVEALAFAVISEYVIPRGFNAVQQLCQDGVFNALQLGAVGDFCHNGSVQSGQAPYVEQRLVVRLYEEASS